jgi:signal peptidase I
MKWGRFLLYAALIIGALALTPFRPLKVTGHSMEPTLHDGETYVLDQFYWKRSGLRRKDIVVVNKMGEHWVKRLIGLPGDTLQIVRSAPDWIDRVDNITAQPDLRQEGFNVQTQQLQGDEIFVIGDNLNRSTDSTTQEAGAFHLSEVIGVVRDFAMHREFAYQHHR